MRLAICHYSNSDNTKLACEYIARGISAADVDLFDMKTDTPDPTTYDLVGFAAFADFGAPSQLVKDFLEALPMRDGAPAFVLNTYGFISGRTLLSLANWVGRRGYKIIAGHALQTPESYPPMIARGRGAEDMPGTAEMAAFDEFIADLNALIAAGPANAKRTRVRVGALGTVFTFPRTRARGDMGDKFVDEELCTECGTCERGCPYYAIKLDPKPVFDMTACFGCWSCYNHCPQKAIYTKKFRDTGHYPKANEHVRETLGSHA